MLTVEYHTWTGRYIQYTSSQCFPIFSQHCPQIFFKAFFLNDLILKLGFKVTCSAFVYGGKGRRLNTPVLLFQKTPNKTWPEEQRTVESLNAVTSCPVASLIVTGWLKPASCRHISRMECSCCCSRRVTELRTCTDKNAAREPCAPREETFWIQTSSMWNVQSFQGS